MSVVKIVTVTTLGSLSAIALVNALLGFSKETANRSAPPDADQNSTKPDQPTTSNVKAAIANPEKLSDPLQTIKITPPKKSGNPSTPTVAKATLAAPSSVNPLLSPERRRTAQPSESERAVLAQSTGRMAPPEKLSSRFERGEPEAIPLTTSMKDIEGHWAQYYVEYLTDRQIVQGFPDGRFRPDRTVTAAEFNSMTQRAFQDSSTSLISYRDFQSAMANRAATRAEAAAFIYRSLVKSKPTPIVTSIQVQGEVMRPGAYSLAAASDERIGQGNNLPTVTRAIQQAGGSLGSANLRRVEIHRLTEAGTQKVIKVDISQAVQTGDLTQDVVLQQDDKLVIPAISPSAQGMVDAPVGQ